MLIILDLRTRRTEFKVNVFMVLEELVSVMTMNLIKSCFFNNLTDSVLKDLRILINELRFLI